MLVFEKGRTGQGVCGMYARSEVFARVMRGGEE
jgi:hypothetical protein